MCVFQHVMGQGVCIPECKGQGGAYPRMQWGRGCMTGGVVTPHYGQQAGGMHPTGMLSC